MSPEPPLHPPFNLGPARKRPPGSLLHKTSPAQHTSAAVAGLKELVMGLIRWLRDADLHAFKPLAWIIAGSLLIGGWFKQRSDAQSLASLAQVIDSARTDTLKIQRILQDLRLEGPASTSFRSDLDRLDAKLTQLEEDLNMELRYREHAQD